MALVVVGVNHHQSALADVAALAPLAEPLRQTLVTNNAVAGVVVLATCNRFELYLDAPAFHPAVEAATAAIRGLAGPTGPALADALAIAAGEGAVRRCFSVAAGLDSMVVGEAEVAGQVRAALFAAGPAASAPLQRLFQHALATSKTVTSRTRLGAAGRSIASVGLDVVESRYGVLADRRVLLIGTGAYARVVCADLLRRGCRDIWVYSRSGRADVFAQSHPVRVATDLPDALARAELVVTASRAEQPVLTAEMLAESRFGSQAALPVIDLSLAEDVDPAATQLPGVDLIDLEVIGAHAPIEAASAVLAAQDIVNKAVETFLHLESGRSADPAVIAMRSHVMTIIEAEAEQAALKYPPEVAQAVARSLRRVSNALLHTPSLRAQQLARTGELDDYRRAMNTLFGIDVPAS